MPESPVTIVQIAKESGVSVATVSRYLNHTSYVSADKQEAIQRTIDKYHYVPNGLAKGLINKRTMTIGVMMPHITNPYFSSIFVQIEQEARKNGYTLLFVNSMYSSRSRNGAERPYLQELYEREVDGVIIVGGEIDLEVRSAEYIEALSFIARKIPVVVLGEKVEEVPCYFVQRQEGAGIGAAIRHLYGLGHRRIAFVGGEAGVAITSQRVAAYRESLTRCGIAYDDRLVVLTDYYVDSGFQAVSRLLSEDIPFTAVLAINDNVAFGVYRALADWHIQVPEDISVISCDQFDRAVDMVPRLSSIDHHSELLAQYLIRYLLSCIQGKEGAGIEVPRFTSELILRESTAPVKQ